MILRISAKKFSKSSIYSPNKKTTKRFLNSGLDLLLAVQPGDMFFTEGNTHICFYRELSSGNDEEIDLEYVGLVQGMFHLSGHVYFQGCHHLLGVFCWQQQCKGYIWSNEFSYLTPL